VLFLRIVGLVSLRPARTRWDTIVMNLMRDEYIHDRVCRCGQPECTLSSGANISVIIGYCIM
jgi:hypothetical protein